MPGESTAASAAQGVANAGSSADPIVNAVKALGELGISAIDASKRRKMDYNMSQQKLNAELGLAKDTAAQQLQLQKLSILANQGNQPAQSKSNTALYIGLGIGALALVGVIVYVVKK